MRDANGITLEVGQSVTFHTWDETDPASPIRVPQTGVIKELSGEVARNQTLGEVTLQSGETLAALAVSVVTDPAPAAPSALAKRKNPSKRK